MDNSPNLNLPYIAPAQAQKHVTHNEALRLLDALVQATALDRTLTSAPASPANGARYIVAAGATGVWAGHANSIAAFQDGAWAFMAPQTGWVVWAASEGRLLAWNGTGWIAAGGGSVNPAALVGVNTIADTTNRLAVKSDASLFDNAGSGHQAKINKAAAGNTASLLFQTGYSGRAEFGTAGDDDFHVKVSADGLSWREALVIDRSSGAVSLPQTNLGGVNAGDVGFDVILAAGQNNALGNGLGLDAGLDLADPRVLQFAASGAYANAVTSAQEPLLHAVPATARNGFALAFARLYAASIAGNRRVLLVPCAVNASGFSTGAAPGDWSAGNPGGALFETAVRQAGLALASSPNNRFAGVLWHQGEADASMSQSAYSAALDSLIAGFRARISGAAGSWFLTGRMTPDNVAAVPALAGAIDPAHLSAPARNARCAIFSGQAGYVNDAAADIANYNAGGQRFLGLSAFAALPAALANASGAANPAPPLVVTGLAGAAVGANAISLVWNALAAKPLDYIVQFRLTSGGPWVTAQHPASSSPARTITGLISGVSYDLRAAGVNSTGAGAWSATISVSASGVITQRDPSAADDSTKGYGAGASWLNASTGALFQASSVAAGAAVWTPLAGQGGPLCGRITPVPHVACGVIKFVAAYSGPCLRVKRASDNTQLDIGFAASGGQSVVDAAAADTFIGASTGTIVKWYDQSGNGRDLSAGAFEPAWTANTVNGYRAVSFINIENGSTSPSLELANSVVMDRGALTAVMIMQAPSPAQGASAYAIIGNPQDYTQAKLIISTNGGKLQDLPGTVYGSIEGTASFMCISSGASAEAVTVNEAVYAGGAQASFATAGGAIGKYVGYTLMADYLGLILYNSALSANDVTALKLGTYANFKITPQLRDVFIPAGDSITAGADSHPVSPYWRMGYGSITRNYQVFSKAASGQTVAFFNTNYAANIAPLYRAGAKNVIFFAAGTNDIETGSSAASLCASDGSGTIKNFCLAARATGFKVIVATVLPRANTSLGAIPFNNIRTPLNTNLRANWASFADGLCDFAGDPVMGIFNASGLDPVYYAGSLHPTKAGSAILGGLMAASVEALG